MKVTSIPNLSNTTDWENLRRYASQAITDITGVINGELSFSDNFKAESIEVTFNAANQTVLVPHTLGFVNQGYIVTQRSVAVIVFDGNTPNTINKLYVQGSAVGTVTLLVF